MHYFFSLERYPSIHTPLLTPLDPTSFTYLVPTQFQPPIKKLLALRSPTWSLPFNIYPIQTSLDFSVISFPETMFLSFRKGISICSSTFLYVIICFFNKPWFPQKLAWCWRIKWFQERFEWINAQQWRSGDSVSIWRHLGMGKDTMPTFSEA